LAENRKFSHPSFSALAGGDPFRIYGKALRTLKLESFRWRFGDPSLHRFWLIHPCDGTDGQTDRIAMAKTRYSSTCCRV